MFSSRGCKLVLTLLLPVLLLPLPLLWRTEAARCLYVLVLMGGYWLGELLPIPVTSLLPVVLFPTLDIMTSAEVSLFYMKNSCMLFIGGLMVAIGIEHSNLHRRVGLRVLLWVGSSPRLVLLGFMLPTAFLSMWISNTASTAMMIPILEAVLLELGTAHRTMMMLAICFSANIGGTATLIGTPPNLILYEYIDQYPGHPLTFASWLVLCLPLMMLNLLVCWLWLQLLYLPLPCLRSRPDQLERNREENVRKLLETRYAELGEMTRHERSVLVLFLTLVLLWMTRSPGFAPGWETFFTPGVSDSVPVLLISLLMFLIPAGQDGGPLLTWSLVQSKLSWGVIILLGGGFALAEGAERSCLSSWLGAQLARLSFLSPQLLQIIICCLVSAITQVASNVATSSMILPVLVQLSTELSINPLYLMVPATLVSSLAFLLPVSTGPNAIVHAASGMKATEMMKSGAVLTVLTMMTTIGVVLSLGQEVFSLSEYPAWAPPANSSGVASHQHCY